MPTGYTAPIKDGITFRQFALTCARAFGALVSMRDERLDAELPAAIEPSSNHLRYVTRAREEQARIEAMTPGECQREADSEHRQSMDFRVAIESERRALKTKYEAMRAQVNAWQAPTPDHEHLRAFMLEQIDSSIECDCHEYSVSPPVLLTGEEWRAKRLNDCAREIERESERHQEEVERAKQRTEWLNKLRESL